MGHKETHLLGGDGGRDWNDAPKPSNASKYQKQERGIQVFLWSAQKEVTSLTSSSSNVRQ